MTVSNTQRLVLAMDGYGMEQCPVHHRWTRIQRMDGSTARRHCPECPRPRGARVINQFTREVVGRMPPELVEESLS